MVQAAESGTLVGSVFVVERLFEVGLFELAEPGVSPAQAVSKSCKLAVHSFGNLVLSSCCSWDGCMSVKSSFVSSHHFGQEDTPVRHEQQLPKY